MNGSKHYTAKDIERYHSGQLSAAEMHAMEKAALDDAFLADALEGYSFTKTPAADLSSLQQRLQLRIQKEEKKKRIFYIGHNWMKIAALFILFAGGGWLVFQTLSNRNEKDVATIETVNKQARTVTTQSADTTPAFSGAPEHSQTLTFQENQLQQAPAQNDVAVSKPASPTPHSRITFSQPASEAARDQATNFEEVTTLRPDKFADSFSRENVTASTMEDKQSNKVTRSDTIKNFDVVLQRTELPLDEVIVFNKNKSFAPDARKRMQVVIDTLEPAEGWTNFDDYVAGNLKTPDEFRAKPTKGEVELSFEVNKQGEPVNITVVKSLCEKCDAEAIRLLKEGPKWKNNKKKGKVKIKFPLSP